MLHPVRLRRAATVAVAAAAAVAAMLLSAGSASAAVSPDGPWSGTGTGRTTVFSDGTTSAPVFEYYVNGHSGTWTFSNTAKTARKQTIGWDYHAYHAWYQVTVKIEKFVIRAGQETATTLRSAGPVNCCEEPSGGIHYWDTTAFDLQPGDVYGFRISGSNFDSDARLKGNLSLTIAAQPRPECTVTNDTDGYMPDPGTALTRIQVPCLGRASATTMVEVHVPHERRGDLQIDLVASDGTEYRLKNSMYDLAANVDQTYIVDVSSEQAAGPWTLAVRDWYPGKRGFLDSWTISV